jgi:hypothetical protein
MDLEPRSAAPFVVLGCVASSSRRRRVRAPGRPALGRQRDVKTAGSGYDLPRQAAIRRLRRYASRRERPTPLPDEAPELIECDCAPVYFVSGLGRIQNLPGGNFLITFYRTDDRHREVEVAVALCDLEVMPARLTVPCRASR